LPRFIVSGPAQSDLRAIARYTLEKWGADQAVKYAQSLRACFQILAENPEMGRSCDAISLGLRRHEQARHVVFYRLKLGGVRIVRVLHRQMLSSKSRFEA